MKILPSDEHAAKIRSDFKEFFSFTVMDRLKEQMLNNKETGILLMDRSVGTDIPVSRYFLNSLNMSVTNRAKIYKFFFRAGIYNFYATSVRPNHYMLFIKLSKGELIGVDVPVGDKKDTKKLMVILCSAMTELYIRYTEYKDKTVLIPSL